jgi:hydroxyethylthiazole kinase
MTFEENKTTNTNWGAVTAELAQRIRATIPLIHHITNFVVMNDTANATLAVGASPVMAHAKEEAAELASVADALVLNPGTLEPDWVDAMLMAGLQANETGIPIVYDPVGVGATHFRNETARRFLAQLRVSVIRANAGEIGALAGMGGLVKGVDSIRGLAEPGKVASDLVRKHGAVIAISGQRDILADGKYVLGVDNGHPMLQTITGSGCMVTTVVAAFCSVEKDFLTAATAGMAYYGLAAEYAAKESKGPGSFRAALLDRLYLLTPEQVDAGIRIVDLT